jgi:hypothetical protein
MKILITLFFLVLPPLVLLAQTNSGARPVKITLDSLHYDFEKYLSGPDSLFIKFNPPKNTLLYDFYQDNKWLVEYFGTNYQGLKIEYEKRNSLEPSRFGKHVADSQYRNLVFERCLPLVIRYLKVQNNLEVENVNISERPKFKEQTIQSYAVKFFYPDFITPQGYIASHICIGINGLQDDEKRILMIEAFCFQVINPRIKEGTSLWDDFSEATDIMGNMRLSQEKDKKLLRAQGVVWGIMDKSHALTEAIWAEYKRMKDWLPFEME